MLVNIETRTFEHWEFELALIEYVLAERARDQAYDELLTRRGDYIELYNLDMDAPGADELLDAIDQTDAEFWQFHNLVYQRYANAALGLGQITGMTEQELLRKYNSRYGTDKDKLPDIDWNRHADDGLYEPDRYPTIEEQENGAQDESVSDTGAGN